MSVQPPAHDASTGAQLRLHTEYTVIRQKVLNNDESCERKSIYFEFN